MNSYHLHWPTVGALAVVCGLLAYLAHRGVVSEQLILGLITGSIMPMIVRTVHKGSDSTPPSAPKDDEKTPPSP